MKIVASLILLTACAVLLAADRQPVWLARIQSRDYDHELSLSEATASLARSIIVRLYLDTCFMIVKHVSEFHFGTIICQLRIYFVFIRHYVLLESSSKDLPQIYQPFTNDLPKIYQK